LNTINLLQVPDKFLSHNVVSIPPRLNGIRTQPIQNMAKDHSEQSSNRHIAVTNTDRLQQVENYVRDYT
jgi:hypothetical protein